MARLGVAALLGCSGGGASDGDAGATTTTVASTSTPSCPDGQIECEGGCVDPRHDPAHCGRCGEACEAAEVCVDGGCVALCEEGKTRCEGACVDTRIDASHCGGCGLSCELGELCVASSCERVCPGGQVVCDGVCVDPLVTCGCAGCPPGQVCEGGRCADLCAADELFCGDACVDPLHDPAHCGGCDQACPAGVPCVGGRCDAAGLNHVLITGQSLSVGWASAVVSDVQPYTNLRFSTGVRAAAVGLTQLAPLVESWDGSAGETIASGLANLAASLWESAGYVRQDILVSAHGVPGARYDLIKDGTPAYAAGLAQMAAARAIADQLGLSYRVRAVAVIHGESDQNDYPPAGNPEYAAALVAWRAAYDTDARAISGQAEDVVMLYCQMSSWTAFGVATSTIPAQQWAVARADPARFALVGPKYFLPYADVAHLTGDGERWLGEHYAKAYRRSFLEGEPWRPLSPVAATRQGASVVVDFAVPSPPLVLDTVMVSDPGNYGFSFVDGSMAPPAVVAVEITGPAQITVSLAAEPTGPAPMIRYAWTGTPGVGGGPTIGPRGNLRDSDPTPSLHGYPLYNWAIHFEEPVR